MTAVARQDKLNRPDVATVDGAKVISSGIVNNVWLDQIAVQKHRPERLMVEGVPGLGARGTPGRSGSLDHVIHPACLRRRHHQLCGTARAS